ncbi:UMP kinase [[Clostridium] colinum]|uniref:UMP kinase n=1 Tax=[Clostridium] colinum TaxID=36835 RepID=UPI00202561D6|nr:UMP kinase [[Clostridium] colinum]
MYKRVILKLSGEALAGDTDKAFDNDIINGLILQIKDIIEKGLEVCIVVGGGNFWRGRSANKSMDRTKADQIGMMATIMNGIYLSDSFKQNNIESIVMTPFMVGSITEQFNKQSALKYLKEKKVLIFAGGIGHPFFSTDTITALRACELEADAILFAKSIDGVYDKDPAIYSDAKKFEQIPCKDIVEKNLQVIDIAAANLCYENKIPVIIFGLLEKNSLIRASLGEKIGTIVTV